MVLKKISVIPFAHFASILTNAPVKHVSLTFFFSVQDMLIKRKDHACAFVKIDEEKGVLVSGGVDAEDNLLDSVEFYSLESQQWTELSPLKRARTEHGMAMIGGLVTVIGGVKDTEFLDSVEVFDHTSAKDNSPSG